MRCDSVRGRAWLAWSLALIGHLADPLQADSSIVPSPPELVDWETNEPVQLGARYGGIIVLDFFAHWCVPCLKTSKDLQIDIDAYYRGQGGNAHGLPVHVLPVNIDQTQPARTRRFVESVGLDLVFEDKEGRLFEFYGGTALPYLVVLDATQGASGEPVLIKSFTGYPGPEDLRRVIDAVPIHDTPAGDEDSVGPPARGSAWKRFLGSWTLALLEASTEALLSEEDQVYQAALAWREERSTWDYWVQVFSLLYDVDYEPAPSDFISQPSALQQNQIGFQARVSVRPATAWQADLQGGYYDGFADYRSVWLDEYYKQYYGRMNGYLDAQPRGYNISPGLRREWPAAGALLRAGFVYQRDHVSPGYEKEPFQPLVRGTAVYDTYAGSLSLENLWSKRLRTLQDFRITATTDHDLRYNYQLSLNWALSSSWVLRGVGGLTLEPPEFHAYYGQVTCERDWADTWFVGMFGRYYTDDGLVYDPKIVTSASPPLRTVRAGISLRYQGERFAGKLAAGPYVTRYDDVAAISRDFSTLYADQDWLFVEAAIGLRF